MTPIIPDVFNKTQKHKFDERHLEKCYSYTPRKKRYWNMWRVIFSGLLLRLFPTALIAGPLRFIFWIVFGAIIIALI